MTELTKRKINKIKAEVIRVVNGLNNELEDLKYEAEADYIKAGVIPPLLEIDKELTDRIVKAFSLNNQISTWIVDTDAAVKNDRINPENEKDYLTALLAQSENFLNLINKI